MVFGGGGGTGGTGGGGGAIHDPMEPLEVGKIVDSSQEVNAELLFDCSSSLNT